MAGNITIEVNNNNDLLVSAGVFAKLINKSTKQLQRYRNDGIPFEKRGERYLFPVREAIKWLITNGIIRLNLEKSDIEDPSLLPPNIRKDLADAKLKEFKLEVEKKNFVKREIIEKSAAALAIQFRDKLISLPDRIVPLIAAEDEIKIEIKKILKKEINAFIEEFSDSLDNLKYE